MAKAGKVNDLSILSLKLLKINVLKLISISCKHLQSNLQYLIASSLKFQVLLAFSLTILSYDFRSKPVQFSIVGIIPV